MYHEPMWQDWLYIALLALATVACALAACAAVM